MNEYKPYTRALFNAKIAKLAKDAKDAVYKQKDVPLQVTILKFSEIEEEAKKVLESALANGTWPSKCKGRELLKAYCGQHGFNYEIFKNLLIVAIKTPPQALADIIGNIS